MANELTQEERMILLRLARQALECGVSNTPLIPLNLELLPKRLGELGATFVTLTQSGKLRGCVGTLEAYQPLAEDVREHAVAAALHDYRFVPVSPEEVPELEIEVSCLSQPQILEYGSPEELLSKLRPNIDGVILSDGLRRATFLPQVWENISDPATFLFYLCQKMGIDGRTWQYKGLMVYTYQVEVFHETAIEMD
jgi:AmmeMemoRadiSam system protein A